MKSLKIINSNNILSFFVLIFPFIIVLRSAATNIILVLISLISIFLITNKKDYKFFDDLFIKYIVIFFGFIFLNSLFQFKELEISLKSLGNYRYLLLTFAVFITLKNLKEKIFFRFIYLYLMLIILIGVDIVYQFNYGENFFGFKPGMCDINLQNCKRFAGVFGSEMIAGAYLCPIGLLTFFFLKKNKKINKKKIYKIFTYVFVTLLFFIILLTGERNALLIFIICMYLTFFLNKKLQIIKFLTLNFIFLIALIIASQNIQSIKSRYFLDISHVINNPNVLEKISNTPWGLHYQAAIELFLDKPLLGHGHKSFRSMCNNTKIEKKTIEDIHKYRNYRACSTHPHSYVMEFLSENGIVGFLFYIIFLFIIFKKIIESRKNLKDNYLPIAIGSLIIAILFPLKPSGSFFTTFNASILFYLLGFFLHYAKHSKS